jgi:hypothetical protein
MRVLLVHPGPLMYSEIYLRLEPLGLERVAAALRAADHEVRLVDLQVFSVRDYFTELRRFEPRAVGFSLILPTRLPLKRFYEELVRTQAVIRRKHLGFAALRRTASIAGKLALHGQTNFLRMIWKFSRVYDADRQYTDHLRPVRYAMRPPAAPGATRPRPSDLYVHAPAATSPSA